MPYDRAGRGWWLQALDESGRGSHLIARAEIDTRAMKCRNEVVA
jgi:hypothetical protein